VLTLASVAYNAATAGDVKPAAALVRGAVRALDVKLVALITDGVWSEDPRLRGDCSRPGIRGLGGAG